MRMYTHQPPQFCLVCDHNNYTLGENEPRLDVPCLLKYFSFLNAVLVYGACAAKYDRC